MSMTRQRPLYRDAVVAAAKKLEEDLALLGITLPNGSLINRQEFAKSLISGMIRTYLDVADPHKKAKRDYGEITKLLGAMSIGQTIELPQSPLQSHRNRMDSARNLMDNQKASWVMETSPGGKIWCTRIEDGGNVHWRDPMKNPKVRELVTIPVHGQFVSRVLSSTRGKGSLSSNDKIMARKYLDDKTADWRVMRYPPSSILIMRIR